MNKMKYPEDNLQMAVCEYLDALKILWCHVANERKASHQAGSRLKKKGVKSGVPDCIIFEPRGKYHGLFIELKIKPNKASSNQKKWLNNLGMRGYKCVVCYSLDEVISIVNQYIKLPIDKVDLLDNPPF